MQSLSARVVEGGNLILTENAPKSGLKGAQ